MVTLDRLLPLAATAFVLIVIPGPTVLFVVSRALAHGRRAALATVVGHTSGVYLQAVAVAIGLGALVQRSIAVFTVHGWPARSTSSSSVLKRSCIADRCVRAVPKALGPHEGRWRFREGFMVGATNPTGFVLFSAILPQFVDRPAGYVRYTCSSSPLVAVLIAVVTDSAWAMAAGTARDWFARSPGRGRASVRRVGRS